MTRSSLALSALLVTALLAAGCQSSAIPSIGSTTPVNVVQQITGNDPGLINPSVTVITSPAQLQALGSKDLAAKKIDFGRWSVVLLALGQQPTGGYWARITGVQDRGDQIFVQGLANKPGPNDSVTQGVTCPYAAALIAKTKTTVVHAEIQSVIGQVLPPQK